MPRLDGFDTPMFAPDQNDPAFRGRTRSLGEGKSLKHFDWLVDGLGPICVSLHLMFAASDSHKGHR
jgi:hypothetical protein